MDPRTKDTIEWNEFYINRSEYWHHGIGFHYFEKEGILWKEWHQYIIEELLEPLDLVPHRAIAQGENFGYSTRNMTYKGLKRKLEKCDYQGLTCTSFLTLAPEAIKPLNCEKTYVHTGIYFGLVANSIPDYSHSNFLIAEHKKEFDLDYFIKIAAKLQECCGATYGYYFRYPIDASPVSFITGWDRFSTTESELKRVKKWGDIRIARPEGFTDQIRDVFKMNFLSRNQLDFRLESLDMTLEDWIKQGGEEDRGTLRPVNDMLQCWYVEEEKTQESISRYLGQFGIVVCSYDD